MLVRTVTMFWTVPITIAKKVAFSKTGITTGSSTISASSSGTINYKTNKVEEVSCNRIRSSAYGIL